LGTVDVLRAGRGGAVLKFQSGKLTRYVDVRTGRFVDLPAFYRGAVVSDSDGFVSRSSAEPSRVELIGSDGRTTCALPPETQVRGPDFDEGYASLGRALVFPESGAEVPGLIVVDPADCRVTETREIGPADAFVLQVTAANGATVVLTQGSDGVYAQGFG